MWFNEYGDGRFGSEYSGNQTALGFKIISLPVIQNIESTLVAAYLALVSGF